MVVTVLRGLTLDDKSNGFHEYEYCMTPTNHFKMCQASSTSEQQQQNETEFIIMSRLFPEILVRIRFRTFYQHSLI
jgi:hypothetical protein